MNMKYRILVLITGHISCNDNEMDHVIRSIIAQIPRERIFSFVADLCNNFFMDDLKKILCLYNSQNKDVTKEYIICSEKTCLEILRYTFAIPLQQKANIFLSEMQINSLLVELLLVINEKISFYKQVDNQFTTSEMFFFLYSIHNYVNTYDASEIKSRVIYQLIMSMQFFQLITSDDKYMQLFNEFLNVHNIKSWNEYFKTIASVVLKFKPGHIVENIIEDHDNLLSMNVLKSLSLSYNDLLNYSSDNCQVRNGNDDYRFFRDRPIIKRENGSYFVFNIEFLADRLYNSLYFEFKSFAQNKANKIDINNLFTNAFSEKHIFDYHLKNCIDSNQLIALSESDCLSKYIPQKKELGTPDYIVYNDSSVFLFECKDIRINGTIIESHDCEQILKEYRVKLYKKDDNKSVGITQLTGHIKSIREGMFKWIDNLDKNISIYPVLVLSDYKNVIRGFNNIANEWYVKSLSELKIPHKGNKPLIVMSFITLFKYHSLFKKDSFKIYFDDYLNLISTANDLITQNITFDDYMTNFQYDIREDMSHILKQLKTM